MTYIVSDIHGCYRQYKDLLRKINFSDDDFLYILGDVVDRGPQPIDVLLDIMNRPNVDLILGNHDFMFFYVMQQLMKEVTNESCDSVLTADFIELFNLWLSDGGETTKAQFMALSDAERFDVLEYLEEAYLYDDIEVNGNRYILVHAGLGGFSPDKSIDEYSAAELLDSRADYSKRYFPDEHTFLVTGHTPTMLINEDKMPMIFEKNGHIAIDCGCVFGGRLAAFCFETGKVTYVK